MKNNPERELPERSGSSHNPDYHVGMDLIQVHGAIMREHKEPKEGRERIPLLLLAFFFGVIFWAGGYLAYYSGGFRADIYNEKQVTYGPVKPTGPVVEDPVRMGKKFFTANCARCHQPDGMGQAGTYPPLAESEWVLGSADRIIAIVLKGLEGDIQVKGEKYNNSMTPLETLDDKIIAYTITYVRQEWGNKAGPVTIEQVAAMREKLKSRTESWKAPELTSTFP
jgi:mono/diheme cytochrome c family protein